MSEPVICLGQQPCGIFPRRFLYSKFVTARRLQQEIGGRIVLFYHDSDHDPRETQTLLRHLKTGDVQTLNFAFENKIQRKHSPLYRKRIPKDWQSNTARQLPAFAPKPLVELFKSVKADNVAAFCLEMYRLMGLLDGIEIVRSSAEEVRTTACSVDDYFVDVEHSGECVRARLQSGELVLHEGGDHYVKLPPVVVEKKQISPTRDTRLRWMQSVVHCTHYVCGAGEQAYLNKADAPEIEFVNRDPIDRSDEAYVPELTL